VPGVVVACLAQALRVRPASVIELVKLDVIVLPAALLTDLVGAGGQFFEAEDSAAGTGEAGTTRTG